ncbi:hypothetical protein AGLY_013455 [Aphis glycines]|uniref:Uncharacterized protein n=1 Tax=Aphis glycines TaxID=307491 RepID=A0A6G0T6I8_APHGL|nr:hypothetical protein AGLY_013455 [Aphis glycines]
MLIHCTVAVPIFSVSLSKRNFFVLHLLLFQRLVAFVYKHFLILDCQNYYPKGHFCSQHWAEHGTKIHCHLHHHRHQIFLAMSYLHIGYSTFCKKQYLILLNTSCNIGISHNAKTSYKKMKIFKDIAYQIQTINDTSFLLSFLLMNLLVTSKYKIYKVYAFQMVIPFSHTTPIYLYMEQNK